MPGTNNFLVFNPTDAVNTDDDATYATESQRTNGLQNGIAITKMHNKFYRQMSVMVAAIAQFMANQGNNVSDADVNALITNITNSFVQQASKTLDVGIDASTYLWQNGIYNCTTNVANMPAAHAYLVEANVVDNNNITLRASDLTSTGNFYQRQKVAGVWGSWLPLGGGTGLDVKEVTISSTAQQTVLTYTPQASGNFSINVYFRVITGTTIVSVEADYTDVSGVQVNQMLNAQSCVINSYSLIPVFVNAVAGQPITIKLMANVANQVIASASVIGV